MRYIDFFQKKGYSSPMDPGQSNDPAPRSPPKEKERVGSDRDLNKSIPSRTSSSVRTGTDSVYGTPLSSSVRKLEGTMTGKSLMIDPVTGYLTDNPEYKVIGNYGNGMGSLSVFGPTKKILFLKELLEFWPNITKCAKSVGVSRATVMNHYQLDMKLRTEMDAIRDEWIDRVEHKGIEMSLRTIGVIDRRATLNSFRSEQYMPRAKIEITHTMDSEEANRRSNTLAHAIDAEVVNAVSKLKTKNE